MTSELRDALKAISARTGAPVAELLRRALADYIAKHRVASS